MSHAARLFVTIVAVVIAEPAIKADEPAAQRVLRVAADPANLPFSNDRREGFENELAELIGREIGARVEYVWRAQRRGFFRESLTQNKCDLVIGVPAASTECLTTRPYYTSSYVLVSRRNASRPSSTLSDPELAKTRIGVQLLADGSLVPPANALIERGLDDHLVTYSLGADEPHRTPALIEAVAKKDVDVAIAWGPLAGYFSRRPELGLAVTPLTADGPSALPTEFEISMGVRPGNRKLCDEVNAILIRRRPEIAAVLDRYGVPRVESPPAREGRP